ncbi:phosphotransferase [Mycobacterium sp.]|uniref:phosphotransferase n=1 Tax=Mycobacterium sp. TaxID=1785 RepID=UPI0012295203|nr:phosphotransferase [Mycobacterium sp.]TAM65670.1 MAG: DUF1679 domain-containing protein [Mycobacterium sp.]
MRRQEGNENAMSAEGGAGATASRVIARLASTTAYRVAEVLPLPRTADVNVVPAAVGAMTARWLTHALCADVPAARVIDFAAVGPTSQTTSRATLHLQYNDAGIDAGLPNTVFAKLTATLRQRMFLGLIRCLEGEPLFYRDLRPKLSIECPYGYYGAVDRKSWRSVVLTEDIAATRSATFLHATSRISRADIESLVSVMAGFHGAMWESPQITRASWLKTPYDHFHNTSAFLNMRKRVAVGVRRTADIVPVRIRDNVNDLWQPFLASMQACSTGPATLLHGDPHVGNTYRSGMGATAFLDWQVCMKGSWAFDYAYVVSTALTVEDRRAWERDLLVYYLDALAAAGGQPPSFDEAFRLYRQCLMYPFHTWTTVIGRSAMQPLMQEEDVCRLIIERVAHAIDDLDAFPTAGL